MIETSQNFVSFKYLTPMDSISVNWGFNITEYLGSRTTCSVNLGRSQLGN